ncbi:MAG: TonB family protein [Pseudomonadota bacterium]
MSTTDTEIHAVLARDMLPVSHGRTDRLPPMLFVASLFYALLILGVSFDLGIDLALPDTTSLEVTIVADQQRDTQRPDDADYLAQANQTGNGNTKEQVAATSSAAAPGAVEMQVDRVGPVQMERINSEAMATELLTTDERSERTLFQPDEVSELPDEETVVAQALPAGAAETLPLPEDTDASLLITDDNPRHLVVSVNSAESDIAPYLNSWKRRVERIGTLNFPNIDVTGLVGSPTLSVSIMPDGELSEVRILRTSGHDALDRAAMMVLNRASPFAKFPDNIRDQYDLLRFAYKFEFRGGNVSSSVTIDE